MKIDPERVGKRRTFLSRKATEAMAKAEAATDAGDRESWLRVAQSWQELIERGERQSEAQ
jgi:hypothetical protein